MLPAWVGTEVARGLRWGPGVKGSHAAFVAAAMVLGALAQPARAQYAQPPPNDQGPWGRAWWPERGHAERAEPEPEPDDAAGQDIRIKSAAGMTGVSAGVMSAGLVTYIVSQTAMQECGLTGCFTYPDADLALGGATLLVAGAGMAVISVPTLIDAVLVHRGSPRRAGRMGWGMALTSLGVGSLASVGYMLLRLENDDGASFSPNARTDIDNGFDDDDVVMATVVQGIFAATYLGVGIPLWAGGGRSRPEEQVWDVEMKIVPTGAGAALQGSF